LDASYGRSTSVALEQEEATVSVAMHLLRKSRVGVVVGLVTLGLTTSASAAPTFTFTATPQPIPGFPGTGDILGAGALIQGHGTITGSEYDGNPPPVIGAKLFAPAGTKLHPQGFATCSVTTLEKIGPSGCPRGSEAGPKGSALGVVSFGGERVPETASLDMFFAPGGGIATFVDGTSPTVVEIIASGRFVSPPVPFGLEYVEEVPLIETVPGAADASLLEATVRVGAAHRQGNKTISYITLPSTCAKGWRIVLELSFLGGTTAQASYTVPCPSRAGRRG
jgi:hypothetical protein